MTVPVRRAFWVILAGTTPTSFRSRHREDLLPTLHQLQRTQPDISLRWFEGGRLWNDPDESAAYQKARRLAARQRPKSWRPGGPHKDPRERFKMTRDQKRARFKKRVTLGLSPKKRRRD